MVTLNNGRMVAEILFTYSWGGFSVRYAPDTQRDSYTETLSPRQLRTLCATEADYARLCRTASTSGLTGHWHKVA